ncbi:hypothetical protein Pa4123_20600 [Phytohabitans aurantiacus]|uniref:Uncharacterized protein n=1 Tax=Phytohabitans aurantiacus TaxID=3016789 RepID=A0ABQ5QT45_9ACTN|nr:hypothetical protein Pa4123_20600 [Phytohabitans aurantiacus]
MQDEAQAHRGVANLTVTERPVKLRDKRWPEPPLGNGAGHKQVNPIASILYQVLAPLDPTEVKAVAHDAVEDLTYDWLLLVRQRSAALDVYDNDREVVCVKHLDDSLKMGLSPVSILQLHRSLWIFTHSCSE